MNPLQSHPVAVIGTAIATMACMAGIAICCVGSAILYPRHLPQPTSFFPSALSVPSAIYQLTPAPIVTTRPTPAASEFGAAGIGDPYYPEMGNGGYDALHYDIRLTVDMAQEQLNGDVTIRAQAGQPLSRFDLDLVGLSVELVLVDENSAAYEQSEGELIITPAAALETGEEFTTEIRYSGRPSLQSTPGFLPYLDGWNFYPGGVIVAGEPTGAETWFPVNNHPLDKATYTIAVTVAEPYEAVANGVLLDTQDAGNGSRTFTWEMAQPMASYLATVGIGQFTEVDATTDAGVPICSFLDPRLSPDDFQTVNVIPKAIDYFASVFGPYPFAACGVIAHDLDLGFALEDQTMVVLGSNYDELMLVHELSHQWFGDSVSLKRWQDIWLNEGFASYAEVLWLEHTRGEQAAADDLTRRYDGQLASAPDFAIGDPGPDDLFDWAVYDRGALTLAALRLKVGDDVFFNILRTYYARFAGGNAGTEDFQSVAEELSGLPLGDFFDAWLYQTALPDIPELGLTAENH